MGEAIYFGWENIEIYDLTIKIHPKSLYLAGPSPFLNFPISRTRQHFQPHVVFQTSTDFSVRLRDSRLPTSGSEECAISKLLENEDLEDPCGQMTPDETVISVMSTFTQRVLNMGICQGKMIPDMP